MAAARRLPALLPGLLLAALSGCPAAGLRMDGARSVMPREERRAVAVAPGPPMLDTLEEPRHSDCRMSEGSCSLAGMPRSEITKVYPGGKTRCMFSNNSGYAFAVKPRDEDKLLIFFEGGGACWNGISSAFGACYVHTARARPVAGVMDHTVPYNPFRDHTTVFISACSGDLHAGNVTQTYPDPSGRPVEQHGYHNVRATLDWIKENMGSRPLSSLTVLGESAGSIGVQVWSATLLSELRYERASVVADSYVGAFPPGFTGPVFQALNVCGTGLLDFNADVRRKCDTGALTVPDVFEAAMAAFPAVSFGSLDAKYDRVQRDYYKLTGLSMGKPKELSPPEFHLNIILILSHYSTYPNHGHFLLSSQWHPYAYQVFRNSGDEVAVALTGGYAGRMQRRLEAWLTHLERQDGRPGRFCEVLGPERLAERGLAGTEDFCSDVLGGEVLREGAGGSVAS